MVSTGVLMGKEAGGASVDAGEHLPVELLLLRLKTRHCLKPTPSSEGLIPLASRNRAILTDGLQRKQPRKHVYS